MWINDCEVTVPKNEMEKEDAYHKWLVYESTQHFNSISKRIRQDTLQILKKISVLNDEFYLSDHKLFDIENKVLFKEALNELGRYDLITSIITMNDQSEYSIRLTPKGRFTVLSIK